MAHRARHIQHAVEHPRMDQRPPPALRPPLNQERREERPFAVPKNISLMFLPSRLPESNPVENIWQYLRANWV